MKMAKIIGTGMELFARDTGHNIAKNTTMRGYMSTTRQI